MSRQTLHEWRKDLRFRRWMADHLEAFNDCDYELMIRKHLDLAIRGSHKSAAIVLKARELAWKTSRGVPEDVDDADPSLNYGVIQLLVPRPPALDDESESGAPRVISTPVRSTVRALEPANW